MDDGDGGYDDYSHEQVMTHPTDGYTCAVCGCEIISWPEGLHHADQEHDSDHTPMM